MRGFLTFVVTILTLLCLGNGGEVLAADADGVTVASSSFGWIPFLLGMIGGAGAALAAIRLWKRSTPRNPEHSAYSHASKYHHDSIVENVYGYYFERDSDGFVFCSAKLHELLEMDDFSNTLEGLNHYLDRHDFKELTQLIQGVREDGMPFETRVKAIKTGHVLECIGLRRPAKHFDGSGITLWFRDVTRQYLRLQQLGDECEQLQSDVDNMVQMLNNAPFPIWQRTNDLRLCYCNIAYAEMVEKSYDAIVHEAGIELNDEVRQLARKALLAMAPVESEMHIVTKGKRRLYRVTEVPVTDINRERVDQLVGYAYDITQSEELTAELDRYKGAQSELLDASQSAMVIFGPDTRLKYYNNAYVRLWKLDEHWLSDEPTYGNVLEALREKRRLPEQANFPAFKRQQLALFTDLTSTHEEFFYLPDGTVLRVIAIPHALGGLLFAYEDVTDRLALERNYNTLIAVQKASLDSLHEAVAVFGEDGGLRFYNHEYSALWKLETDFLDTSPHITEIADHMRDYHCDSDEEWVNTRRKIVSLATNREARSGRVERKDGSVVDWRCVPLPDGAMEVVYYDVTDSTLVERSLREKNEALLDADRVKTEFLASVSYELRSPLTSIMGFSEALKERVFGELNKKQQEYVEDIYTSSNQLMALINDILDLASIEAGYMRLHIDKLDIFQLLSNMKDLSINRVAGIDIDISLNCPEAIGFMEADEMRMKQVMFNLLSNAIKFSHKKGKITIGAKAISDDDIMLWVEDNGVGIAKEEQQQVFRKFFKGSEGQRYREGTGLGLSMVRRFTELHDGRVELQSEVDKGTRINLYFKRHYSRMGSAVKNAPAETVA